MVSVQFLFIWHDKTWNQIDILFKDGKPLGGNMVKQDAYDTSLLNVYKATVRTLYRCAYEQVNVLSKDIDQCTLLTCSKKELTKERLFPSVNSVNDQTEIVYHYIALCTNKPYISSGQWVSLHETNRIYSSPFLDYINRLIVYQKKNSTLDTCTEEPMIHPDPYQQFAPILPVLSIPYPALSYFLNPYVTQCKPLVDKTNVLAFSRKEMEEVVDAMNKGISIELVFPTLKLHKIGDFYTFNEVRAYISDPLVKERWKQVFEILWRYPSNILFTQSEIRDKMTESLTSLALASICERDLESVDLYTTCVQWLGGYWDKNVLLFVQYECSNDVPISQKIKTIIQSLNVISAPYNTQKIKSLLLARVPPEEIIQMGIRKQLTINTSPKRKRRVSLKMKKNGIVPPNQTEQVQ